MKEKRQKQNEDAAKQNTKNKDATEENAEEDAQEDAMEDAEEDSNRTARRRRRRAPRRKRLPLLAGNAENIKKLRHHVNANMQKAALAFAERVNAARLGNQLVRISNCCRC